MKSILIVFLFIFLCHSSILGQNKTIDSLKSLISLVQNHSQKLQLLSDLVSEGSKVDFELEKKFAQQGYLFAEQVGDKDWQPKFYEMYGRVNANLLHLDSATFFFNKALNGYKAVNNKKGQATTYFKIGWVHKRQGQYKEALDLDLEALKLMESLDDKLGIAGAYSRISEDLLKQERNNEALEYALKTIKLCKKNNLHEELFYAYNSAGDVYMAMEDYQKSFEYFDLSLQTGEKYQTSPYNLLNINNSRANALKRMGRYKEALSEYQKDYFKAKEINYENALYVAMANLGEVNKILGNYPEALKYQLKTIELQEENKDVSNLTENYGHLSSIYEKMGDYKNALIYQKKARMMRDSLSNLESDKTMSEMLTKFETEKKEQTITAQSEVIAQQSKIQWLYLSIAFLMLMGIISMYFYVRNIRRKRFELERLNGELDTKNSQNELLLKEIHHRVKNNLELVKSLLALQSAQLSDKASKDAMLESQNRVQSMGIIHQKLYQGTNLGSIEMRDYFLNLGEGILDTFNAEDKIKIECAMENLELDVDTAVPIGLIVNELLTNALKYAFQDKDRGLININLYQSNRNVLTLMVSDDGIGKSNLNTPLGTGFGTQLISLLTKQLNGKMSAPNANTIEFHFKLNSAA